MFVCHLPITSTLPVREAARVLQTGSLTTCSPVLSAVIKRNDVRWHAITLTQDANHNFFRAIPDRPQKLRAPLFLTIPDWLGVRNLTFRHGITVMKYCTLAEFYMLFSFYMLTCLKWYCLIKPCIFGAFATLLLLRSGFW